MSKHAQDRVVLDTLGKLHAHRHGLNGYCRSCQRHFEVPLPVLIAARGAHSPVVEMRRRLARGDIMSESMGGIISESPGGFVGIRTDVAVR